MRTLIHPVLLAALVSTALLSIAGCDVKKTASGNVTLPKYEVEKTKEGDVTLPKYSVTTPEVQVSNVQKEVLVPKVVMEKQTITVPEVQVTPAAKQ
jgi:predicted RecA/RadA family phage recombinase